MGPAEMNNVVGSKPTRGLIAIDGTIPISSLQGVVGTLTRTVRDAAYLLNSMAGRSEQDEETWNKPFNHITDFIASCQDNDLRGIAIGDPRNTWESEPPAPIETSFANALDVLRSAGAKIVDSADFPAAEGFKKLNMEVKGIVRSSEFKRDIIRYIETLETNPNNIESADDIIAFTKSFPGEDYPEKGTGKFERTQAEGVDVDSDKYKEMVRQEQYFGGPGGILRAMEKHNLNLLVVPADQEIANDLAAKMRFPVISIALGFWPGDTQIKKDSKKPKCITKAPGLLMYSLLMVTKAYSDDVRLRVAHAFKRFASVREHGPVPIKVPVTELIDVQQSAGRI